jgi:hypothetical protein
MARLKIMVVVMMMVMVRFIARRAWLRERF